MHTSIEDNVAAGASRLHPIAIQEVAHVGEEEDTPVTNDPGHDVVGGWLQCADALPPPLHHGVFELPVHTLGREAD
eukprot:6191983-Alexandrium_andersonii.AAC.1